MTRNLRIRIVVASLILLGDGALASEVTRSLIEEYAGDGYTVQMAQPACADDETPLNPPMPKLIGEPSKVTAASHGCLFFTNQMPALLKHHAFYPRAPPFPPKA